jgi:hypothetical protein
MYLPKQAEPVQRTVGAERQDESTGVEPQMDCWCAMSETLGVPTWHCDLGKPIWDTLIPCP